MQWYVRNRRRWYRRNWEVHHSGGFVLVQDIDSSAFDGMPRSAVNTGLVDVVASPDRMPEKIIGYASNPLGFKRGQLSPMMSTMIQGDMYHLFRLLKKKTFQG
ncbi:MAG: chemotaxis protein CheB [Planctomycetaceae bacterium]